MTPAFFIVLKYIFAFSIVLDAVVALWVLIRYPHSRLCRAYFYFMAITALWEIIYWFEIYINFLNNTIDYLLDLITFGTAPLLTILAIYFILVFHNDKKNLKPQMYLLFVLALLAAITTFAGKVIGYPEFLHKQQFEFSELLFPGAYIYYGFYLVPTILIYYLLIHNIIRSIGVKRLQAIYILIGLGGAFFSSVATNIYASFVIRSTWDKPGFYRDYFNYSISMVQIVGVVMISILTIVVAYAITRYRLFDIRVAFKRWWLKTVIILGSTAVVVLSAFLSTLITGEQLITFALVAGIGMIIMQFLLTRFFQTHLTSTTIDLSIPENLELKPHVKITFTTLLRQLEHILLDRFQLQHPIVCVLNWKEDVNQSVSPSSAKLHFPKHHALAVALQSHPQIILRDSQKPDTMTDSMHQEITSFLYRHKLAAVIPLSTEIGLLGVVFIPQSDVPLPSPNVHSNLLAVGRNFGSVFQQLLTYEALTAATHVSASSKPAH